MLIPEAWEHITVCSKKDFSDVIQLNTFRERTVDCLGGPTIVMRPCKTDDNVKVEPMREDATWLAFMTEGRTYCQKCRVMYRN